MSVRLNPKVKATAISPGTALPFNYQCEESIPNKSPVAKSETTGSILLAQASTYVRMPCFGISIQSGDAGDTIKVISTGIATGVAREADFSYDDEVFVSTEKGQLTKTPPGSAGALVQSLGRALNSSDIILNPSERMVEILEL